MTAVSSLMDRLVDLSKNSLQYGNSMCPSMILCLCLCTGKIKSYCLFPQVFVARTTPLFSNFLFTNLFSIKFLYFSIISSLFPYFNLFVSIFIQSHVNNNLHVSTLDSPYIPYIDSIYIGSKRANCC